MAQVRPLNKLRLKDMILGFEKYFGLPEGLAKLPTPREIKIGNKTFKVPMTKEEVMDNICYGQRVFLMQPEDNDFKLILRTIEGYYYPLYYRKEFDTNKALFFGKKVVYCKAKDLYPVAMHMITLLGEIKEQETKLLSREPSKIELAAGIEKLSIFSELTNLDFLRDDMKITMQEVLLTPYKECLVRFMIAKETRAYEARYVELLKEQSSIKNRQK